MISYMQFFNFLIFMGLIVGILWFVNTVVGSLKKIESRLESIENLMNNKKN